MGSSDGVRHGGPSAWRPPELARYGGVATISIAQAACPGRYPGQFATAERDTGPRCPRLAVVDSRVFVLSDALFVVDLDSPPPCKWALVDVPLQAATSGASLTAMPRGVCLFGGDGAVKAGTSELSIPSAPAPLVLDIEPRSWHAAAWADGYLAIGGGFGKDGVLDDYWLVDVSCGRVRRLHVTLSPLAGHAMIVRSGVYFVLGGTTPSGKPNRMMFVLSGDGVQELLAVHRVGASIFEFQGALLLSGGQVIYGGEAAEPKYAAFFVPDAGEDFLFMRASGVTVPLSGGRIAQFACDFNQVAVCTPGSETIGSGARALSFLRTLVEENIDMECRVPVPSLRSVIACCERELARPAGPPQAATEEPRRPPAPSRATIKETAGWGAKAAPREFSWKVPSAAVLDGALRAQTEVGKDDDDARGWMRSLQPPPPRALPLPPPSTRRVFELIRALLARGTQSAAAAAVHAQRARERSLQAARSDYVERMGKWKRKLRASLQRMVLSPVVPEEVVREAGAARALGEKIAALHAEMAELCDVVETPILPTLTGPGRAPVRTTPGAVADAVLIELFETLAAAMRWKPR